MRLKHSIRILSVIVLAALFLTRCSAPPAKPAAGSGGGKSETPAAGKTEAGGKAETPAGGGGTTGGIKVAALADAPPRVVQGLKLTFEAANKQTDSRSTRLVALYVPDGTPPTPFLPAGPFKAVFEGELSVSLRDEYIFSADGNGSVVFEINGQPVLESKDDFSKTKGKTVKLNKGKNKLVARYESPKSGDAMFRMFWESASGEFVREPLPIVQLFHDADEKSLRESRRLREGRELFALQRCTNCHDATNMLALPAAGGEDGVGDAMPEMGIDAPNLSDAGGRLNMNWIAQWVKNPRALRPESSMPKLLHGATAEKDAIDIAAYLATLGKKDDPTPPPPSEELIKAGGGVVETLGCVACHTMPDNDKVVADRIPLRNVRAKWKPAALREFLKQPDKHYSWIRMPNFRFTDEELTQVTAFLLHQKIDLQKPLVEEIKGAPDAANGQKLVQSAGCINCHSVGAKVETVFKGPALKAIPETGWAKGCLAEKDDVRGKAPDFSFKPEQRDALVAFVASGKDSLKVEAMPEFAERQVKQLRCIACHRRDSNDDLWSSLESETAAIKVEHAPPKPANADPDAGAAEPQLVDQLRPRLTWTGEKLKPEWLGQFIGGEIKYKPRTWLFARMPGFPKRSKMIAKGLVIEHGYAPISKAEPAPNPEMAEVGKKLAGQNGGLACTKCHSVGVTEAIGVFEAPGINFMHVKDRLLKSYFHRWVRDPLRVEDGSKMPTFATQGKTQLNDIYEGDAKKQFEALWQYLLHGDKIVAPEE